MLKSVEITNYQAIHKLELDLAPYTVIVGPSSSGKSAFTRALKTLISNKRGTAFITQGEKTCIVTGNYENVSVTLTRSTSTEPNSYVILEGEHEEKFTKLGGNVPEEVTQALGIEPNSVLHFAGQFDSPFLLNDSPAEAARQLASLTDANVILEAARASNSDKLAKSRLYKTRAADLETAEATLEQLPEVEQYAEALDRATKLLDRADELKNSVGSLERVSTEIVEVSNKLTELKNKPTQVVPNLDGLREKLEQLKDLHQALDLSHEIKSLQLQRKAVPEIAGLRGKLETLKTLRQAEELASKVRVLQQSKRAVPEVPGVREVISQLANYKQLLDSLTTEIATRQELQEEKQRATLAITEAETRHRSYLAEIQTCPTCGQSTNALK